MTRARDRESRTAQRGRALLLGAALFAASFSTSASPVRLIGSAVASASEVLEEGTSFSSSSEREEADQNLKDLREKMKEEKRSLSRALKKEGNLFGKLAALKDQIKRSEARTKKLEAESEVISRESEELKAAMDDLELSLLEKRRVMSRRLKARYIFGRKGEWRLWIEAGGMSELSRRRAYIDSLYRSDKKKIDDYRLLLAEWRGARDNLAAKQKDLDELESVLAMQREEMESEKVELDRMLRAIREEREAHEQALAEMKASESRLSGIIAELDRAAREEAERRAAAERARLEAAEAPVGDAAEGAGEEDEPAESSPSESVETSRDLSESVSLEPFVGSGLGSMRGSLCYPASGPVTSRFGKKVHPEFNTVTMQNGVEIGAPLGAPVKAVHPGIVRYAKWFRGYGNLIIIDHGEGWYTVYAHLNTIAAGVGSRVNKGDVIGTVGDTGSISGASLYFEVRHHQTPRDPAGWLGGCAL